MPQPLFCKEKEILYTVFIFIGEDYQMQRNVPALPFILQLGVGRTKLNLKIYQFGSVFLVKKLNISLQFLV